MGKKYPMYKKLNMGDGRFKKGIIPHNKKWFGECVIKGCERKDLKAYGLCHKHYKRLLWRRKRGQDISLDGLGTRLPVSEEHGRKISIGRAGIPNSFKGKTYKDIYGDRAEEIANKKRGENSGTWQGGKSFEVYPQEFNKKLKEKIRVRDGFKCVECGVPEKELFRFLDIHHIDENKRNNSDHNLVSLCHSCHRKIHNTKQDWINYFRNLIKENINA